MINHPQYNITNFISYTKNTMADLENMWELIVELINEKRYEEIPWLLPSFKSLIKPEEENIIVETTTYLQDLKDRIAWNVNTTIIPTGFKDIDDRIFGAVKWNIMTICARTGWGKTTLGLNIALNMLKVHKVGFISLEMTEEEICDKIVSRIWRVRHSALSINKFADREIEWIKTHANEIKYAIENLVRANNCYDIEQLSDTIEKLADRECEVIFVDWLWMIEAPGNSQPEKMRVIMSTLKELATERNIAIIAMQQLNRQMDWSLRIPRMYDIADGSAIEKISSPVLIMWREDDNYTNITIYKARRLNADKFMDSQWKIDWEKAVNLKMQDDLWFSWFKDYEQPF